MRTPPRPPWPPRKPPPPEWSDHVKRIYERGCDRIDELRKQMEPDGVCPLPFRCYGCDTTTSDFGMITGDGVPICSACLSRPRGDE